MITRTDDPSIKLAKPKKKVRASWLYNLFFWIGFLLILVYFYYKIPLQNLGITTLQNFSIKEIITSVITKNFANLIGVCSSSILFFLGLVINSSLANIFGLLGVIMMFISSLSVTIIHAQENRFVDQYQKVLNAGIAKKELPELKQPHSIRVIQPVSKKEKYREESPVDISRYGDVKKQMEADKRKEEKIRKEIEKRKNLEEKKLRKEIEEEERKRKREESMKNQEEENLRKKLDEEKEKEEKLKRKLEEEKIKEHEKTFKIEKKVPIIEELEPVKGTEALPEISVPQNIKKIKEETKHMEMPAVKNIKGDTEIDQLYSLLEKYKSLKISQISQTFGIDKNEAIDWCRILVENGLAELSYPAFGEPILKLKQEE